MGEYEYFKIDNRYKIGHLVRKGNLNIGCSDTVFAHWYQLLRYRKIGLINTIPVITNLKGN